MTFVTRTYAPAGIELVKLVNNIFDVRRCGFLLVLFLIIIIEALLIQVFYSC